MLTVERLRELLSYDPETGAFVWLVDRKPSVAAGEQAGNLNDSGYLRITVDQVSYRASRLAWFYMTGGWPKALIDHKDRDRVNNRWLNLREATSKQNSENVTKHRDASSRYVGVYWITERKRWGAAVCHNGKIHKLGRFKNEDDAAAARAQLARKLFTHAEA